MKDCDNCLDSQLWHACAGGMVQMPAVNTKVFYFPQGHAEHAQGNVDFGIAPKIPPQILCTVEAINFMADPATDEVFAKIRLSPVKMNDFNDRNLANDGVDAREELPEKLTSFAKTLTQSDANNGGGFSVPRYCAETIFPRLDHSIDPPVQTVLARDVHGEQWKFRHIYRGTPRRHLLTTGWSTFVNQKKLMAGDSIVFLRADNGELRVGIRRAKRGIAGDSESPSGWNSPTTANCRHPPYCNLSGFLTEEDNCSKFLRNNLNNTGRGKERVTADTVLEAANLAANGQPFFVVYYPRASTPEFCVKASSVRTSTRIQWTAGMRFKMAFETEDSSRISWFMGTISGLQFADPIRWPQSPWRVLQVTWDEPDLLQNVKRVSPWLVELVSTLPPIHISPFSPPRKKLRHHPTFDGRYHSPTFAGKLFGPPPVNNTSLYCLSNRTPAGIQGARHGQFGSSLSDLHFNKLQSSSMGIIPSTGFRHYIERSGSMNRNHDYLSNSFPNTANVCGSNTKLQPSSFLLFGKTIQTTETSSEMPPAVGTVNRWTDDSFSHHHSWMKEHHQSVEMSSPDMGHCKVFMESEDVGRTLDLSALDSYEELCLKLTDMFGIPESNIRTHVCYRNSTGAVKYAGDEPFAEFKMSARRLMIVMDSGEEADDRDGFRRGG